MMSPYARRQLLIGGASTVVAGAALAAQPRRDVANFSRIPLGTLIPEEIDGWIGAASGDVVPEQVDGSIDHGQTLSRLYEGPNRPPTMLVVSYHGPQSPDLKVHRPETCYRVAGFATAPPSPAATPLGSGLHVPSVTFVARRGSRVETVLYWTRVGDRFPQTLARQRLDFFREALRGVRADGLLMRASIIGEEPARAAVELKRFAASLVAAAAPPGRRLLLGSAAASLGLRQVAGA